LCREKAGFVKRKFSPRSLQIAESAQGKGSASKNGLNDDGGGIWYDCSLRIGKRGWYSGNRKEA
jgi:hypothetical protein